ncbi:hypothetical protein, partial [Klebsiella pneumoniae]|uniref:hypothetical protein n=1 Tax=Klebsiella pneumoniae TaxID=573 RepID=UPI0030139BBB
AESGLLLTGLFILLAMTGEAMVRWAGVWHGVWYAGGCAAVAAWSLLLVTFPLRGIDNPVPALAMYAVYGIVGLVMN